MYIYKNKHPLVSGITQVSAPLKMISYVAKIISMSRWDQCICVTVGYVRHNLWWKRSTRHGDLQKCLPCKRRVSVTDQYWYFFSSFFSMCMYRVMKMMAYWFKCCFLFHSGQNSLLEDERKVPCVSLLIHWTLGTILVALWRNNAVILGSTCVGEHRSHSRILVWLHRWQQWPWVVSQLFLGDRVGWALTSVDRS